MVRKKLLHHDVGDHSGAHEKRTSSSKGLHWPEWVATSGGRGLVFFEKDRFRRRLITKKNKKNSGHLNEQNDEIRRKVRT